MFLIISKIYLFLFRTHVTYNSQVSYKVLPVWDASATPAAAKTEEPEDLTDDLELVAVIAAAIAAYEGTSADGFQVRSIRRANTNKWKKA